MHLSTILLLPITLGAANALTTNPFKAIGRREAVPGCADEDAFDQCYQKVFSTEENACDKFPEMTIYECSCIDWTALLEDCWTNACGAQAGEFFTFIADALEEFCGDRPAEPTGGDSPTTTTTGTDEGATETSSPSTDDDEEDTTEDTPETTDEDVEQEGQEEENDEGSGAGSLLRASPGGLALGIAALGAFIGI